MLLIRRTSYVVALAFLAGACSDSTGPAQPRASVSVQTQSLAVTTTVAGSVTWINFTVPLRIHNAGSTVLNFDACASRIEARSGNDWNSAWSPICVAMGNSQSAIPAGEAREFSVTVVAATQGPGGPMWRASTVAGSYRFVAGVIPTDGVTRIIPTVASNTFELTAGN